MAMLCGALASRRVQVALTAAAAVAIWLLWRTMSIVDYEDVVFANFLTDYRRYRSLPSGKKLVWNDEVRPAWWKWPPRGSSVVFSGAPVACERHSLSCIYVSIAAMSLFLRGPSFDAVSALTRRRTAQDIAAWKRRPVALCQLYGRQRPHRVRAWQGLAKLVRPSATLNGTERNSVQIFTEATTLLSQCRFALAMEGHNSTQFVTEKVVNAFLAGAVPVYWGSPAVTTLFNRHALVNFDEYADVHSLGRAIVALDRHPTAVLSEPAATPQNLRALLWWRYNGSTMGGARTAGLRLPSSTKHARVNEQRKNKTIAHSARE